MKQVKRLDFSRARKEEGAGSWASRKTYVLQPAV